jgi:hypothetical protein
MDTTYDFWITRLRSDGISVTVTNAFANSCQQQVTVSLDTSSIWQSLLKIKVSALYIPSLASTILATTYVALGKERSYTERENHM